MKDPKTLTGGLMTASRYGTMALLVLTTSNSLAQSTLPEVEACHRENRLSPGAFIQCAASKWQADIERQDAAHKTEVANLEYELAKARSEAAASTTSAVNAAIEKERSDYQTRTVAANTERYDSLKLFGEELSKSWEARSAQSSVTYDQSSGWVFAKWDGTRMYALNFEGIASASIDRSDSASPRLQLTCTAGKNWCAFGFQDGALVYYKHLNLLVDSSNAETLLSAANRAIIAFPNR